MGEISEQGTWDTAVKPKKKPPQDETEEDAAATESDGIPDGDDPAEPDDGDLDDPDATVDRSRLGGDGDVDEH